MSAAEDIARYLDAQGEGTLGGSSQWSLNVSREPSRPNATVTCYDSSGGLADPDNGLYTSQVQVRVRHKKYVTAFAKAKAIRDLLIDPRGGFTANGTRFVSAHALSEPEGIGYDENDRALVVLNLDLVYEE